MAMQGQKRRIFFQPKYALIRYTVTDMYAGWHISNL